MARPPSSRPSAAQDATAAAASLARKVNALEQQQMARDFSLLSHKVRKRPVVLFFGRNVFSDNSKYLYLHAVAQPRGYEVLWCTFDDALFSSLRARELPCVHLGQNIDHTIDLLLHAAVVLYTVNPNESLDYSVALAACVAGAAQVQLWHGISVKQLTLQLIPHLGVLSTDLRQPWAASASVEHMVSPSSALDSFWRSAFGCRSLLRAGLPRNEVILRQASPLEMVGAELSERATQALQSKQAALLVVPTWQRGQGTGLGDANFLDEAMAFAERHDCQLFFKAHPSYFGKRAVQDAASGRLHLLDPGLDIYPWLFRFNALITDYSSIMFDFLLGGRPVLTLDLQPGEHQSFEPNYSLVPPGDWRSTFTVGGLADPLAAALDTDAGRDQRMAYAEQVFETDPLSACADLMLVVDELVDRSQRPDYQVWQPGQER